MKDEGNIRVAPIVPSVLMIDSAGKHLGLYEEDSGWWQRVNNKHNGLHMNGKSAKGIHSGKVTPFDEGIDKKKLIAKNEEENIAETANRYGNVLGDNTIGESPLHIAIMYDDMSTIKYLIDKKGYNVNQRCVSGSFISGFTNKLTSGYIQKSQYEFLAYYGEYPLALAGCFSTKDIYDFLIDQGADPNLQDSNGNTVLHTLAINNRIEMFQYAANHPKMKGSLKITNNQELTPTNLAAFLGRKDIFSKLIESIKMEIWSWSTTQCSVYPLEGIDTIASDGTLQWNSALSFIVSGETEDHLDMLEIGLVKQVLSDKWATFAKKKFYNKFIFALIHIMILVSIAVYTRATNPGHLAKWPADSTTWARYVSEAGVVLMCLITLIGQCQEIYAQGFIGYLKNLFGDPANVFYIVFCILIITAVPFRFVSFSNQDSSGIYPYHVEDQIVIVAVTCGWMYFLFFARVFETTGPFVVMIYKMVIGDIMTFGAIYLFLLFGFSLAFYYLYRNAGLGGPDKTFENYGEAIIQCLQMTVGVFALKEFDKMYYSDFTKCVFVAFMVIMHILLINMLIAMMGNTYHQVIKRSTKEYRRQWSNIVLLIERGFTQVDLLKFQNKYCMRLPSKDPANPGEMVGLMVIKERPKTRAFTRAEAIRGWKRLYKCVLGLLKESKSTEILAKWDSKNVIKPIREKKPFDWSHYEPDALKLAKSKSPATVKLISNGETKQMINKNNNGIAYTALKEEPKMIDYKPEPKLPAKPLPRHESTVGTLNEINKPILSQKQSVLPNQTIKVYPPLKNHFTELNVEELNKIDISDVQRPNIQISSETYLKNPILPTSHFIENFDFNMHM